MNIHVLLGPGGVGKTTLAAAYALALAERGGLVGLLGIDPSRRLQDVIGVTLGDAEVTIAPNLRAAVVEPHHAIARWIGESCPPEQRARLAANPFFAALGDRLATAVDLLAAVRVAEWVERAPALTDLVIDTAPGLAALDFVRAPRQLASLVEGRMLRWLRAAATGGRLHAGARILRGLAGIGGARLVIELADFFALSRAPLARMLARVEAARDLLTHAEILLVTSPRDTGAAGAAQLAAALRTEQLAPATVIVNRTWPLALAAELGDDPLSTYARAELAAQDAVLAAAAELGPVVALPSQSLATRAALAAFGAALVPIHVRSAA